MQRALTIYLLLGNFKRAACFNNASIFKKTSTTKLWLICYRYFSRFQYCRYALHVRQCKPNGDGISSFNNLLDLLLLRACVWIVAFITCIGNASVVLFRILCKDEHRVHSLLIKNLCGKWSTFTLL